MKDCSLEIAEIFKEVLKLDQLSYKGKKGLSSQIHPHFERLLVKYGR